MKKALFALVFLALVGFGVWRWWDRLDPNADSRSPDGASPASTNELRSAARIDGLIEPDTEVRALAAPVLYQMKDDVFDLELSEYAGYAGLIVANGGLAPSDESLFFKNYGFKVRITISEEESWDALNSGRIGGSATTVDVLAVYAKTLQAVVPAQIGFSRGSDAIVVLSEIKRVNQLKGRTVVASQFTEADFFIRYLASEAGIDVKVLEIGEQPDPEFINLVYATDSFEGGDLFAKLVNDGRTDIAGAVLWGSKIQEVLDATRERTRVLVDNRNLLVVADVLVVNKPFAVANPRIVEGLVDGLLAGNDMIRTHPDPHLDLIAKAFKWESRTQARSELAQIHFSNLPENKVFFSGAIDAAGSYGGIFQSAMFAYGSMLDHSVPPERLLDLKLEASFASKYAAQTVSIQPIRSAGTRSIEENPLLTRDIQFFFEPNSAVLSGGGENDKNYGSIKQLLQVAPGSTILLRGHVDNSMVAEFRKQGGEKFVRDMALKAMELSRQRAESVRAELAKRYQLPSARIEIVGRGWEEPAGTDADKNRRVEVQWFTVE